MAGITLSPTAAALDALASLLGYPGEGFEDRAADAATTLAATAPAAAAAVMPFLDAAATTPRAELEERFTRTFDWSPTCCLEVGWHLFGERYERGAFLADMRGRLRAAGVEEGTDLPDHLGSCLRWLGRAEPAEAAALARDAVLPALAKIRPAVRQADVPWAAVLDAVETVVRGIADGAVNPGGR